MADNTPIEWTDASWNPLAAFYGDKRGWMCSKPSTGCKNCYSERLNLRLGNGLRYTPENVGKIEWRAVNLDQPSRWRRPRRIFVNSMTDLFHEAVPDALIGQIWSAMLSTPRHVYQALTKRAERMRELVTRFRVEGELKGLRQPDHIWLGVSVENQEAADRRIPELLQTPAALRFLSIEPLLGPIDLLEAFPAFGCSAYKDEPNADGSGLADIHWVIVGGESGPNSRPMQREWVDNLIAQCRAAQVPVFVKQLGAAYSDSVNGEAGRSLSVPAEAAPLISCRLTDPKGGDMTEWPEALRIRQFPVATVAEAA